MKRGLRRAAWLGLVLLVVGHPGTGRATFPGTNGRIVFIQDAAEGWPQVFTMNPDGSGRAQLTSHVGYARGAVFSPDGNKIAFSAKGAGPSYWQIFVMNADGTDLVRLTDGTAEELDPTWSPDGTRLAWDSIRDGNEEIYVMNADGSAPVNLTRTLFQEKNPRFSPDGNWIAFDSEMDDGVGDIYVIRADGSQRTRLTFGGEMDTKPRWSPDGRSLIWTRTPGGCSDGGVHIWRMNADGSAPGSVVCGPGHQTEATYSPDGSRIVFGSDPNGLSPDVFLADSNGALDLQLTFGGRVHSVDWGRAGTLAPVTPTFVVDSTGDDGDAAPGDGACRDDGGRCTLRAALEEANASPDLQRVHFALPTSGVATIAPLRPLPPIQSPVVIDGTSQPGASCRSWPPTLPVELSGARVEPTTWSVGLEVQASGSFIRGLVINAFANHGLVLRGSDHRLECNLIGTRPSGAEAAGNRGVGIWIPGQNHRVGGRFAMQRNLIAGNGTEIDVSNEPARGNVIEGNFIGTDVTGTRSLARAIGNLVGLGEPDNVLKGNLISGGDQGGVSIAGERARGNLIEGNRIGVAADGRTALPNRWGIVIQDAQANVVGPGNIIGGNLQDGIMVQGPTTADNRIVGNILGTDLSGTTGAGNGGNGIWLFEGVGTVVGTSAPGEGNTIVGNGRAGVEVDTGRAYIQGNALSGNGTLGIELAAGPFVADGVTPNDELDADEGANGLQNHPTITSARLTANFAVLGELRSTPSSNFTIDVYASPSCDSSGHGEGARYLGSVAASTDENGHGTFGSGWAPTSVAAGEAITATATDASGRTSELSACVPVVFDPSADLTLRVTAPPSATSITARTPFTYSLQVRNAGPSHAPNARVTIAFTGRPRVLSMVSSTGSCAGAGPTTVSCALGQIGRSQTRGVSVSLEYPADGQYTITGDARADAPDPTTNAVTTTVTVLKEKKPK